MTRYFSLCLRSKLSLIHQEVLEELEKVESEWIPGEVEREDSKVVVRVPEPFQGRVSHQQPGLHGELALVHRAVSWPDEDVRLMVELGGNNLVQFGLASMSSETLQLWG